MSVSPSPARRYRAVVLVARIVVVAGVIAFLFILWTAHKVISQATHDETRKAGAIVVLGAAEYAGRPSPVLRARLDHAFDLWQKGYAPFVITTGGGGADPQYTEGGV